MSAESFKIAKEINSLSLSIDQLEFEISKEEARISFIENNRTQRKEQLEHDQVQLNSKKNKIQHIENEIAKKSKNT